MAILLTGIVYFSNALLMTKLVPYIFFSKDPFKRRFSLILTLTLPTILLAFRGTTGSDSRMYIEAYDNIIEMSSQRYNDFEAGFVFIAEKMKNLNLPSQVFFGVIGLATILFFLLFLSNEKNDINVSLSTFIFFSDLYFLAFNMMRQALAIVMLLYAYSLFSKKKYLRYVMVVVCASLFHISGLMGFAIVFAYLVVNNRYYKQLILGSVLIGVFLAYNRTILGFIAGKLTNKAYALYILANTDGGGSLIGYLARTVPPVLVSTLYITKYKENNKMITYYAMMLAGYVLTLLSLFTGNQVQRIGYNFLYINIAVLGFCAKYPAKFKIGMDIYKIERQTIAGGLYVYYTILCIYTYFIKGFNEIVPYIPKF